jgi:tetratricopeptide (TPR) repeat protein
MQKDKYSSYDSLSSGGMPRIFWIIVGVATALAIFIVLFLLLRGFQDGQRQSEAQRRQQIAIYLQNGQDATSDGDQQSALDAYRRVLILDPENEEAIAGIGNLLNGRAVQPSPTVAVLAAPTPDAPVSTPTAPNPLAVTWVDAQNLYNAGRWEEAIVRLRQVRLVDADFERARVEEMLFTAYVSLGTEKSNGGSLEEAVTLFDRALEIRPDAVETRATRDDTAQYVDALTYWFADWPKVIELLSDLHTRNPGYRDVSQRLQKAHLEYADMLSRQSDWCRAAQEYTAAISVQNAPGLIEKQAEFQTLCAQNPEGLADAESGELAADDVTGLADAPAPVLSGGLGTGRILYGAVDVVDGRYRIYAQPVTASVRPVMLVEDALQPALRGDGQRLAFRNVRGDQRGIGSYDPGTGLRLRFTNYAEDSFPSWNGEGNQLVFASDREGDRRWRIYTAWADGNDNGVSLGYGQDPQWHTGSNRIVFRGCDERGNSCGLWIMNGSGGDRVPLTSIPGDAHPSWSPDGRYVVFMSQERSGNWEVYRVDVQSGAVLQLTTDANIDGLPAVSPDSSRVAFLSNRDGSWAIWIKPLNGGPEQILAPITGELPNWMEQKIQWVP